MPGVNRLFPLGETLGAYDRSWFSKDLIAAVTVWAIVVPESMAYAGIAGMPPETGLYASTFPLLAYAVWGSSRRITVGPAAAVAALSLATVAPFAAAGSEEFVSLSLLLAVVVGTMLVVAGLARLGIIADFLSEPVLKGFIVGVALTIIVGQAGKVFGVEVEGDGFFGETFDFIRSLPELHVETVLLGLTCLVALFVLHRVIPRIPAALLVVVGSIIAVRLLDLEAAGVHVAGEIPSGLPSFAFSGISWGSVIGILPGAIGVAIVVYGESMALSKTFGSRHRERVDADQELVALGAANVAGGLFGGFATSASNSRSAAADSSGQQTQVTGLATVALLVLTMLFLTPLFADLPEAALGAVVIHAVIGLVKFGPVKSLARRNRVDFWAAMATLIGVLIFDVLGGLMIGVVVSLVGLMSRAVRPQMAWLGRDSAGGRFRNLMKEGVTPVTGVSVMRFGSELFFANASVLRDEIMREVERNDPHTIVLDAEAVTAVDTTAADELLKIEEDLGRYGVRLVFARVTQSVREDLERSGIELDGRDYTRVADAVDDSVQS